jgi:hypothetical protein
MAIQQVPLMTMRHERDVNQASDIDDNAHERNVNQTSVIEGMLSNRCHPEPRVFAVQDLCIPPAAPLPSRNAQILNAANPAASRMTMRHERNGNPASAINDDGHERNVTQTSALEALSS